MCDPPEAGNWSGYLYESSKTHSEKSRLDFLALRSKNYLESKKKVCLQPKKKSLAQQTALDVKYFWKAGDLVI